MNTLSTVYKCIICCLLFSLLIIGCKEKPKSTFLNYTLGMSEQAYYDSTASLFEPRKINLEVYMNTETYFYKFMCQNGSTIKGYLKPEFENVGLTAIKIVLGEQNYDSWGSYMKYELSVKDFECIYKLYQGKYGNPLINSSMEGIFTWDLTSYQISLVKGSQTSPSGTLLGSFIYYTMGIAEKNKKIEMKGKEKIKDNEKDI